MPNLKTKAILAIPLESRDEFRCYKPPATKDIDRNTTNI
jgi:hypothetical protein